MKGRRKEERKRGEREKQWNNEKKMDLHGKNKIQKNVRAGLEKEKGRSRINRER